MTSQKKQNVVINSFRVCCLPPAVYDWLNSFFLARVWRTGGGVEPLGADGVPAPFVREPLPGHAGLHEDTAGQPEELQPGEKIPALPLRPVGSEGTSSA